MSNKDRQLLGTIAIAEIEFKQNKLASETTMDFFSQFSDTGRKLSSWTPVVYRKRNIVFDLNKNTERELKLRRVAEYF